MASSLLAFSKGKTSGSKVAGPFKKPDLWHFQKASVATPEPGQTRMASPNRNPVDTRLILFILQLITFSFSKVSGL